jgi:dUTP pyrophosphatase
MQIQVNIINQSNNALPKYETAGSAGMDVRANLTSPLTIAPMQRYLVPTGLSIAVPAGYEAQMRPRSGLAVKQGLTCLNSPGTIDSDYRGEIKVLLINLGQEPQTIQHGDRIAQLVFAPVAHAQLNLCITLDATERNQGGFGSTGNQ